MSKTAGAAARTSTDKNRDAADDLATLIADDMSIFIRNKIKGDPGFNSPAFGSF
jgi:hypothetical protein